MATVGTEDILSPLVYYRFINFGLFNNVAEANSKKSYCPTQCVITECQTFSGLPSSWFNYLMDLRRVEWVGRKVCREDLY